MSQIIALVEGEVNMRLNRLAPESWRFVRGQNVLQTSALGRGGSLFMVIEEKR